MVGGTANTGPGRPAIAPQIMAAESLSPANQPQVRAILQGLEITSSYVMRDDGHDHLLS
jgi:hypothetical protein